MRDSVIPLSSSHLCYNFGSSSNEALVMPSLDTSMPMDNTRILNLDSFCWDSSNFINSYGSPFEVLSTGYGLYSRCDTFSNQLKNVSFPAQAPVADNYSCSHGGQVRKRRIEVSSRECKGGKRKKSSSVTTCEKTQQFIGIQEFKIEVPARRKQKLSEKITTLQKLVSPYGKTDTASVLQEASLHIKLLHKQLQMLSQSASAADDLETGLRSRGLCLLPLCLANKVTTDPCTSLSGR